MTCKKCKGLMIAESRPEFEAAAVEAVSGWKFRPGRKGGREVVTHLQVPIVFSLGDGAKAGGLKVTETPTSPHAPFTVQTQPEQPKK